MTTTRTTAANQIQRVYRGWAAREGKNGLFMDFAVRARASAAATRIQRCCRGWIVRHHVSLPAALFSVNNTTSFLVSPYIDNFVPIEDARRKYLHALAARRTPLLRYPLNAGTVLKMIKDGAFKFAQYKRHRRDAHITRNFGWITKTGAVGTEWPVIGSRRAPTEADLRERDRVKNIRRAAQPSFVTRDILSIVAKFLPVTDWASLVRICSGAVFSLPRNHLRKQFQLRVGYYPSDPLRATLAYSAARGMTNWRCKKTVVFGWTEKWGTAEYHGRNDRIINVWSSGLGNVHFITANGKCGTYCDKSSIAVRVSHMSPMDRRFAVYHASVGHDGCICVVHTTGLTVYENKTGEVEAVAHVPFSTADVKELACVNARSAFIVHGRERRLFSLCRRCPSAHLQRVNSRSPVVVDCRLLKASRTGVVWRAASTRLCRSCSLSMRATEILPRKGGNGRIVYISDMLPCLSTAVLYARGARLTEIGMTDGTSILRSITLLGPGRPRLFPMMSQPFSTAGDMVMYRDSESREMVAVRPQTDKKLVPRPLAFMQVENVNLRYTARHRRNMYFIGNAVYVVEQGGRQIVKYTAEAPNSVQ